MLQEVTEWNIINFYGADALTPANWKILRGTLNSERNGCHGYGTEELTIQ
jgi:hypothetical protein